MNAAAQNTAIQLTLIYFLNLLGGLVSIYCTAALRRQWVNNGSLETAHLVESELLARQINLMYQWHRGVVWRLSVIHVSICKSLMGRL